ncbi:MAG: hypothetical protein M3O02_05325, partial [Acidobacteriota bacterium]|nr:hypothetical protein [Acidobacteriota bacterium]
VYAAPFQAAAPPQASVPAAATEASTEAPAQPAAVAQAEPNPAPEAKAAGKGKKEKKKKEKAPKLTPIHIEQGTLTVDGWTGKARLNYDIADLKYIYVWAPGIGTIVASNQKFPLAREEQGAFNDKTLTLEAGGHTIQISSEKKLLKNKKPVPAYVYLDTTYKTASAFPQMGYGNGKDAPYAWPGANQAPVNKGGIVAPPPLPAGMRAAVARRTCTPVQPGAVVPAPDAQPQQAPCPAAPAPATTTQPNAPAAAPPVPLPGYRSGTTTAKVDPTVPDPPVR